MKKLILLSVILFTLLISFQPALAAWGLDDLGQKTGLPTDAPGAFIARVVSYFMGFVGVILIVIIIYGGFLYMTSHGNEKQTEMAKSVLTYAIIGVVIIFAAYIIAKVVIDALTTGSTQAPATTPTTQSPTPTP